MIYGVVFSVDVMWEVSSVEAVCFEKQGFLDAYSRGFRRANSLVSDEAKLVLEKDFRTDNDLRQKVPRPPSDKPVEYYWQQCEKKVSKLKAEMEEKCDVEG